jgi:hypothetical protein
VPAQVLARAGCTSSGEHRRSGYHREHVADAPEVQGWVHLAGDTLVKADPSSAVLVHAGGHPTLVATANDAWWQPPELADPSNPLLPRSQYGSVASAAAVARWYAGRPHRIAVEPVAPHEPVTVQWWYTGDRCCVLAGNLEAGWIGDARTPRTVTLDIVESHGVVSGSRPPTTLTIDVPPEACVLTRLSAAGRQEPT